ncbi:SDR family NAD(P)-dependent oxidoreductase [Acinetobacter calcoaceticus]|uniref:SDR family NAD(P)-dependent oxidoreductase n=1 Tax=Acinetobacter calcoaceticus TaxID=471 RepID=UPI00192B0CA9|nr:SDR family NAD(P)-dependent oxidoreductase [Acinetobacter calcoaceticus]
MLLQGRIAFITGAASGIASATAKLFANQGAIVIGADLNLDKLKESLSGIPNSIAIQLDVSDSQSVKNAFEIVKQKFGKLDILVNAAGINAPTKEANDRLVEATVKAFEAAEKGEKFIANYIENITDNEFKRVIEVNLNGSFYCLREATPLLKKNQGGTIINISSVAALTGPAMPLYYPASKAAVIGMTKSAARELAPFNIRVNAVAPGAVDTPLLNELPPNIVEKLIAMQPIQRAATPDELAQTLLFLVSDAGSYYTGQTISPSGGLFM